MIQIDVPRYLKAIVAFLIPIIQVVQSAVSDNTITGDEWMKIAIAVVLAIGVYAIPNKPKPKSEEPPTPPLSPL